MQYSYDTFFALIKNELMDAHNRAEEILAHQPKKSSNTTYSKNTKIKNFREGLVEIKISLPESWSVNELISAFSLLDQKRLDLVWYKYIKLKVAQWLFAFFSRVIGNKIQYNFYLQGEGCFGAIGNNSSKKYIFMMCQDIQKAIRTVQTLRNLLCTQELQEI